MNSEEDVVSVNLKLSISVGPDDSKKSRRLDFGQVDRETDETEIAEDDIDTYTSYTHAYVLIPSDYRSQIPDEIWDEAQRLGFAFETQDYLDEDGSSIVIDAESFMKGGCNYHSCNKVDPIIECFLEYGVEEFFLRGIHRDLGIEFERELGPE
ncbi:hypothetical protein [Halomicrococcus sp. SG-WS-1]|uniref:hypothetical protein n=1 Tax=Halomicrococcus sp. SG-WS-1 TaxID=3439057 RepID=UPI003F7A6883